VDGWRMMILRNFNICLRDNGGICIWGLSYPDREHSLPQKDIMSLTSQGTTTAGEIMLLNPDTFTDGTYLRKFYSTLKEIKEGDGSANVPLCKDFTAK
jgi:hypothetical protein